MDTGLPSKLLTVQHQQIDQPVEAGANGAGDAIALAAALKLLREHLYVEEVALFPPLAATGLTMPVFVMLREHGEMWPLIARLEAACAAGADAAALRSDARLLLMLLKMHNPKEEEVLYAAADRYEPMHPAASLIDAMAAARMPAGWMCKMAPK